MMGHLMTAVFVSALVAALFCLGAEARADATLDWMEKAYGDGQHNAFTDLIRWQDSYYLCFRHGTAHGSMEGEIRVMRSPDMKTWEPCGTLDTWGDDRDPHFAAKEDTLYVYFGTWDLVHATGHGTPGRGCVRSHFATSKDGATWSKVQGIYEPGFWLWRVRNLNGTFYSAGYTAVRPRPSVRETRLLRSEDGLEWTLVSVVTNERLAGEADMWLEADGTMRLLTRTGDAAGDAALFQSDATLTQWQRTDTGVLIHSPAVVKWKDRYFISGRARKDGAYCTKIWELAGNQVEERITLPSGGDTSYPGLLVDPATLDADSPALFVSWYSQHARDEEANATGNTASVYVARVIVE